MTVTVNLNLSKMIYWFTASASAEMRTDRERRSHLYDTLFITLHYFNFQARLIDGRLQISHGHFLRNLLLRPDR